jgi:hypothetical protein
MLPLIRPRPRLASGFDGRVKAGVMAKQTKVTVETDSLLVLRGRKALRGWCPQCAAEGEMIPFDALEVVSNLSPAEVEAWLESEEIHRSHAPEGTLLICFNSLLKRIPKTKPPGR